MIVFTPLEILPTPPGGKKKKGIGRLYKKIEREAETVSSFCSVLSYDTFILMIIIKFSPKMVEPQLKWQKWDFPGRPLVKTLSFHCRGTGSITDQGSKIPHATWHSQNKMSAVISWEPRAEHTLRKYLITQLTLDRLGFWGLCHVLGLQH